MAPHTNIKSYLQQQHAVAAAAAAATSTSQKPTTSEQQQQLTRSIELIDQTPPAVEIVRSYDEIDQIYDYIRGLAPLPDNLRRMKSIDFEQIEQRERQKRIQQQQELQKLHIERKLAKQQQTKQQQQQQQQHYLTNSTDERQAASVGRKSARLRQRSDETDEQVALVAPPVMPLRVTTSETRRPTVKRVESLNLKQEQEQASKLKQQHVATLGSGPKNSKPSYLISSSQSGSQQPFRLPRAQSSSTLTSKQPSTETNQRSQQLNSIVCSDLVESYVDDDDDDDDDEEEEEEQDKEAEEEEAPSTSKGDKRLGVIRKRKQEVDLQLSTNESSSSSPTSSSEKVSSSRATRSSESSRRRNQADGSQANVAAAGELPVSSIREEHIYEQIPAHQDLHHLIAKRTIEANETRPALVAAAAAAGPAPAVTAKLTAKEQRQRVPTNRREKIDYPVAYSANVAANARYQQQVAALFACQQQQRQAARDRHQQNYLQHQHNRRPNQISQFSPQISAQHLALRGQHSMPRSLNQMAHHHRLSMGNLHLLSTNAPNIPMASLYKHAAQLQQSQTAAVAAAALYQVGSNSIGRSSSSSRVNKLASARAPLKLSGAELIGRIQVPRAVSSKRHPLAYETSTGPRPSQLVERPSLDQQQQQQKLACAYVWQQPIRASVKQTPAASQQQQQPIGLKATNGMSRLAQKRASGRRLTAIGIEQSLDVLGQRPVISAPQQNVPVAHTRANLKAARASFFEPVQLVKAPLIDADENIEELSPHSSSAASSPENEPNVEQNHRVALSSVKTSPLAARRPDSISDLHSFSSSSQTEQSPASNSTATESSEPTEADSSELSDGSSSQSATTTTTSDSASELEDEQQAQEPLVLKESDIDRQAADNFVSSRSFIKCYYGQQNDEEATADKSSPPGVVDGKQTKATKKSLTAAAGKSKRLGSKLFSNGERLLSLIGLDTIGSGGGGGGGGDKTGASARNQVKAQRRSSGGSGLREKEREQGEVVLRERTSGVSGKLQVRRTSAPPTPLGETDKLQHHHQLSSSLATATRRRFSSAVANSNAGERTMPASSSSKAPRPSLAVCHFEHPIVEKVAKVSSNELEAAAAAKVKLRGGGGGTRTSSRKACELQEVGSTNTTNSTSSYEAAIKNSAGQRQLAAVASEQQQQHPHTSNTSRQKPSQGNQQLQAQQQQQQSTLIRVPKLSKQSHLLNRPLPKVPAASRAILSSTSATSAATTISSHQRQLTANQATAAAAAAAAANQSSRVALKSTASSQQPSSGNYTQTLNSRASGQHRNLTGIDPQHVMSALATRFTNTISARSDHSTGAQSRAAKRYLLSQQQQQQPQSHSQQAHLFRKTIVASSPAISQQARLSKRSPLSTNLDAAEPTGSANGTRTSPAVASGDSSTRHRQRKLQPQQQQQQQSGGSSSASLKSPSGQSQNRLSSLGTIQPSPTVTTYTSSGISSTHLATNASSSSSQRSKASSAKSRGDRQPSKSSAEIRSSTAAASRRTASSSSNTLEGSSSWQQSGEDERSEEEEEDDEDDDEIDMIDGQQSNSISPDIMRFETGGGGGLDDDARRGHLKSFDERFSSKYVDKHLASSNDSLLESINFSGTLDSARRKRPSRAT